MPGDSVLLGSHCRQRLLTCPERLTVGGCPLIPTYLTTGYNSSAVTRREPTAVLVSTLPVTVVTPTTRSLYAFRRPRQPTDPAASQLRSAAPGTVQRALVCGSTHTLRFNGYNVGSHVVNTPHGLTCGGRIPVGWLPPPCRTWDDLQHPDNASSYVPCMRVRSLLQRIATVVPPYLLYCYTVHMHYRATSAALRFWFVKPGYTLMPVVQHTTTTTTTLRDLLRTVNDYGYNMAHCGFCLVPRNGHCAGPQRTVYQLTGRHRGSGPGTVAPAHLTYACTHRNALPVAGNSSTDVFYRAHITPSGPVCWTVD